MFTVKPSIAVVIIINPKLRKARAACPHVLADSKMAAPDDRHCGPYLPLQFQFHNFVFVESVRLVVWPLGQLKFYPGSMKSRH